MKFTKKPVQIEAVRWNAPDLVHGPKRAQECTDHPAVRPTCYMEVHALLGTTGCSLQVPFWTWEVMGVLEGKHVVIPGD